MPEDAAPPGDGGRDRDRNEFGRPENQRPRDLTGRPLPYDTDETDLAEEWAHDTVEEALDRGAWLWERRRYFEAHECLEDVWHHAADGDEDFWQGVIQVAVACVHAQRGNPAGVVATCHKAQDRLEGYPDRHHGIDVAALRAFLEETAERLEEDEDAGIDYPDLPVVEDGPWFDGDADATPVTRQPPWMAAATGAPGPTGDGAGPGRGADG